MAAGETVSIVGPSGSGKSTMMMVVAGLERPTAGRVAVAGQELGALSEDQLALFRRERIGIVFQDFHLIPTMSALENVAVPLELAGRRDAFERAERELAGVGLGHRLGHYPGPALRRRAAAGGARARLRHRARACCWPTSRPAISTARPAATSST